MERIKQRDGSVNEKEIRKIGYEAGAKYICMVELDELFGKWNIGARMVDVETAEIYLAQGETDIKGKLENADFSGAAKVIFDQIHSRETAQTPAPAPTTPPQPPQPPQPTIDYGSLNDSRDGKTYKTVVIGGKTWMAENLNYQAQPDKSWCYFNCRYGILYDWEIAKTVCPAGYHLPTRQEWNSLVDYAGGKDKAGKKLKARSGWSINGNGTDAFGFSALPGGNRNSSGGSFVKAGSSGYWWTATEQSNGNAYYRNMNYDYDRMKENDDLKSYGFSVRCVAN